MSSIPTDSPPSYEEARGAEVEGRLEQDEAESQGENANFLNDNRDSLSMELDSDDEDDDHRLLFGNDNDRQQAQRHIEQFDIEEQPQESPRTSILNRATIVSSRWAHTFNSKLISPVQRIIIDPVAHVWTTANSKFDAFLSRFGNPLMFRRLFYLVLVAFLVFVAVSSGILPVNDDGLYDGQFHDHAHLRHLLTQSTAKDAIRDRIEYMSSMPHMAGTAGDLTLAQYIKREFVDFGLRTVELGKHSAYLTYPSSSESNMELQLLDDGRVSYAAKLWEGDVYKNPQKHQVQSRPMHALSASGEAEGHIIYAHYGTKEDIKAIPSEDLKGAIVFIKYGRMATGLKVRLLEEAGAKGVVTFSDHSYDKKEDKSWPDGPGYPEDSIERDSIAISAMNPGDILTPGWAAESVNRVLPIDKVKNMPKIPTVPVSWKDAKHFLNSIKGQGEKKDDWSNNGKPSDVDEWWTGNSKSPKAHLKNKVVVQDRHALWNVFGKIDGMEQSEKIVIIGAQRDSYCYGAVESMSGTAVLMELARVFSLLNRRAGWTPLRTIVFASWDGSTQNFVGSTEFAELNEDELKRNGLVYIDLNEAVSGDKFRAEAHPLFDGVLQSVLSKVYEPVSNNTIASTWNKKKIPLLGGEGDFLPFSALVGIPSIRVGFEGRSFPRHSCFDSLEWMKKFGDHDYAYHKTLADILAFMLLKFSDEPIIDLNIAGYGSRLQEYVVDLERYAAAQGGQLDFGPLKKGSDAVLNAGVTYNAWLRDWRQIASDGEPPVLTIHRLSWNSRLAAFNKYLLDRNGITPHRNWFKHLLLGPQLWHPTEEHYEWNTFPGIRDHVEAKDWESAEKAIKHAGEVMELASKHLTQ